MSRENLRRDSTKGGADILVSALGGWKGEGGGEGSVGVSDIEEGSGPEIVDLQATLTTTIRTVTYCYNYSV